ncbi:MAG: metallophosphoesterase family protein [Deltaproteobacteria bacterium]|nr:metallophosphoesterase family protein [Deltaproteobacteria bacterium]
MRYAILSDIHSNLEALTSVLSKIDTLRVDEVISLGDIVGYNADPNECIEIIRKRGIRAIMGNHDSRAAGLEEPADFNPVAAEMVYWTRKQLTKENIEFLKGLPGKLAFEGRFLAFHGWMDSTDGYILSASDAAYNFSLMGTSTLAFFGHTHVRLAYLEKDGVIEADTASRLKIRKGLRYLVNPGAVGQPRDGDPRSSFLVYDDKKGEITFFRVGYDMERTREKIIGAGLPQTLAERLRLGM